MRRLNNCESRLLTAAAIVAVATPLALGFVHAQQNSAPQNGEAARLPSFDVATVKPNDTGCCTSTRATADQMTMKNQTLKNLVVLAYSVQPYQVTGPDWMEKVRFDITAKYPAGTKYEDRWLMLRTLLEERFKLVAHSGTKEMSGYSLEVGNSGFKLQPSDPGEPITVGGNQGAVWTLRARKIPMSALTYELADSLGEVVVDETGLTGAYSFELRWATNETVNETASPNASESEPAPSVFTALEETLGLRLRHGKVQAPVIVVDHVERTPTEN
ncbi:MAG: TIGR03435 family protein [Terracidiphilus sp.]|nr:TIGR03435 family protein [Terracidiphilus sp.]MDR3797600.1 TIGR03435 family protein [Terracidiphilus sp.]